MIFIEQKRAKLRLSKHPATSIIDAGKNTQNWAPCVQIRHQDNTGQNLIKKTWLSRILHFEGFVEQFF
jgi:hypothetical protein